MDFPKNAAVALDMLKKHYGVEEIKELADLSGIKRGTLDTWAIRGETSKPNATTRIKWRRIFSGEKPAPVARERVTPYVAASPPDLAAIHRDLIEVRDLLRSFLTLDHEGRAGETVKAKAKRQGGGAA